jgi:archaellum biogenesis ATPase FlaH
MNDTDPVERVLARLDGVRRESDGGFVARCPAHDDSRPSLRVARGDSGNCLLHCRAGCSTDAVLRSLGLRMSDLSAGDGDRWQRNAAGNRGGTNERAFDSANAAANDYAARLGKWARSWTYTDAAGEPAGLVLRWDKPDGSKRDVRPVWRIGGKWRQQSPSESRPLFNLDDIGGSARVFVVEGEKCAELLHSLGFAATTSSGGSAAAHKSEWSSLAGREVCIVPDADKAGERYADDVRGICEALDPPARVRIVRLPGLAADSGDDIEQWLEARADRDAATAELRALADAAFAAEQDADPPPGSVSLADLLDDGSIMEPPEVIESGMVGYDRAMPHGAVEVGTITVWGGEPGAGKSRWMVNLMAAYARRGVRVAYLFGEMTAKRHSQRLLLAQADCGSEILKSENPDNRGRLEGAAGEMRRYAHNLRFIAPRLTLEKLTDAAKWADVVCVDALQSVRIHGHPHRHEELEAMFQHCVSLCAERGTVFQMTSTIAKGEESKSRGLHSAFKGGSEIEQYADFAWFIEDASEHGVQQVRCLKGRDGPKRPFELHTGCGGLRVCTVPPKEGGGQWM